MQPRYLVVGFYSDGLPTVVPIEDALYDTRSLEEAFVARDATRNVASRTGCGYRAVHVIVIDEESGDQ